MAKPAMQSPNAISIAGVSNAPRKKTLGAYPGVVMWIIPRTEMNNPHAARSTRNNALHFTVPVFYFATGQ